MASLSLLEALAGRVTVDAEEAARELVTGVRRDEDEEDDPFRGVCKAEAVLALLLVLRAAVAEAVEAVEDGAASLLTRRFSRRASSLPLLSCTALSKSTFLTCEGRTKRPCCASHLKYCTLIRDGSAKQNRIEASEHKSP